MKLTKIATAFAALVLSFGLASCNGKKDSNEFVLGLDDSFPPMGFRDENNEIVGYDIDLAKEVCSRIGMTFRAQPIDWRRKSRSLTLAKSRASGTDYQSRRSALRL